jgi:hypothetical protein
MTSSHKTRWLPRWLAISFVSGHESQCSVGTGRDRIVRNVLFCSWWTKRTKIVEHHEDIIVENQKFQRRKVKFAEFWWLGSKMPKYMRNKWVKEHRERIKLQRGAIEESNKPKSTSTERVRRYRERRKAEAARAGDGAVASTSRGRARCGDRSRRRAWWRRRTSPGDGGRSRSECGAGQYGPFWGTGAESEFGK